MRGTKRLAMSDSVPDTNDSAFGNKRIMAGSLFDVHRAEPSRQQSMATPALDKQRAESSQQHVRALNNQFASWVQTQLKNHPDELWEDGVRDYLTHASNIMEKFSDVVNWLKANAVNGGNLPAFQSQTIEKKLVSEIKNKEVKLFQEKTFTPPATTTSFSTSTLTPPATTTSFSTSTFTPPATTTSFSTSTFTPPAMTTSFSASSFTPPAMTTSFSASTFTPPATTTSFSTSWSSGVFSNSQTPVFFGSQISVPTNNKASTDADDENEVPQPSSPSVKKSEEKGIVVVHEVKCKLYVKSTDPANKDSWKDKGTGQLSIKCKEGISKGEKESKPTVVVRNDVGKVVLNALLYPGIKTHLQKNSIVAIFHTSGDDAGNDGGSAVARTFLIRTKTEEDRDKLATAIQDYAPSS